MNTDPTTLFVIGAIYIVVVIASVLIGDSKGRGGEGFVLGLLLGVIGLIVTCCLAPSTAKRVERERARLAIQMAAYQQTGVPQPPPMPPTVWP
jgi:hypothetical protein